MTMERHAVAFFMRGQNALKESKLTGAHTNAFDKCMHAVG